MTAYELIRLAASMPPNTVIRMAVVDDNDEPGRVFEPHTLRWSVSKSAVAYLYGTEYREES